MNNVLKQVNYLVMYQWAKDKFPNEYYENNERF